MGSSIDHNKESTMSTINNWPRILLIEDNAGDVVLIKKRLLSQWPKAGITAVARLSDAYEAYINANLDIILLDLNLPDGFGHRSVEEALSFVRNVPVVVLTSMESKLTAQEAKKCGATEVILKSHIMSDEFGTVLSNILTSRENRA